MGKGERTLYVAREGYVYNELIICVALEVLIW